MIVVFFRAACEFTFSNGTLRVNKEGDSCTPMEFNQVVFLCNHVMDKPTE